MRFEIGRKLVLEVPVPVSQMLSAAASIPSQLRSRRLVGYSFVSPSFRFLVRLDLFWAFQMFKLIGEDNFYSSSRSEVWKFESLRKAVVYFPLANRDFPRHDVNEERIGAERRDSDWDVARDGWKRLQSRSVGWEGKKGEAGRGSSGDHDDNDDDGDYEMTRERWGREAWQNGS